VQVRPCRRHAQRAPAACRLQQPRCNSVTRCNIEETTGAAPRRSGRGCTTCRARRHARCRPYDSTRHYLWLHSGL
jgi:hypothetical protein